MQDNQNEYIDYAWNEMRKLLDQEMPVRRRRPVWWWLVGIAGLLGFLLLGWYLRPAGTVEQDDAAAKSPGIEQVVAASAGEAEPGNDASPKTEILAGATTPSSIASQSSLTPPQVMVVPPPYHPYQEDQQNNVSIGLLSQKATKKSAPPATDSTFARAPLLPVTPIPVRAARGVWPPAATALPRPVAGQPVNAWSFGLEGALIAQAQTPLAGGLLGLTTTWQRGRWALHSGVGWAQHRLYTGGRSALEESLFQDVSAPGMTPQEERTPQLPAGLAVQSRQLRIPLWLGYRLSHQWQIGTGLDLRYWLKARQQWTYGADPGSPVPFDTGQAFIALSGQKGDPLPGTAFHRWDVAPLVQCTYRLSDQWQLSMGVRIGLRDMSKITQVSWYDRSAWLGVQGQF